VKAVVFDGAGGNDVVSLADRPDPVPVGHDVLVAARFAGVNWADVAQRQGFYPPPPGSPADIPGLEVAGTVQAVGEQVLDWRPGDRVFGIVGGGGLADRVIAHERHLAAVPDGLEEQVAAAVPEAYVTAHDAVFTRGGLAPGEVLLVTGANGAVGTAGVQLGLAAGARVIACVRTAGAGKHLAQDGAIVASPAEAAPRAAELGGVDVVLELVGTPNLAVDMDMAARMGRIVIVGTPGGADASVSLRSLMTKRLSLIGTVLRARPLEEKAAAVRAFGRSVVPLLAAGTVRPRIDRVFPAAEVTAAFDYLAKPGKSGKVLLAFD
jgi:NADPH:quinone reductase-like Zn-dependent oxidoreductase